VRPSTYVGATRSSCTVSMCRDCCCGTRRKHPDVDHDALLQRLDLGTQGHARVAVSTCLLACGSSNVVVVAPSRPGREAGGRPVWFQQVLDDYAVDAIAEWVRRGGPGLAALPEHLRPLRTSPPTLSTPPPSASGS
jgi:(2Fe-2S) ferredoxin